MCTTYFLVAFHPFIPFPASSALISFPLEPINWKGSEGGRNPGNMWPYSTLHLLGTILEIIIGPKEQMQIKIYMIHNNRQTSLLLQNLPSSNSAKKGLTWSKETTFHYQIAFCLQSSHCSQDVWSCFPGVIPQRNLESIGSLYCD